MKLLLLVSIFLLNSSVFANERQRQIEYQAINLVIQKYGKGSGNILKGTRENPSNRSWYENEYFVSVAAGRYQEFYWSSIEWYSVNVCTDWA